MASRADVAVRHRGWTPLMSAAEHGHATLVDLLVVARSEIDATNKRGRSALSFAVDPSFRGAAPDSDTVAALLTSRADPNLVDDMGASPAIRAARNGIAPYLDPSVMDHRAFQTAPMSSDSSDRFNMDSVDSDFYVSNDEYS